MPLEKNYDNVVTQKEEKKQEITKLTVLEKTDKNTIYNLIFTEPQKSVEKG